MWQIEKEPFFGERSGMKKIGCYLIKYLPSGKIGGSLSTEVVTNAYNVECAYVNRMPSCLPDSLWEEIVGKAELLMGGKLRRLTLRCPHCGTPFLDKVTNKLTGKSLMRCSLGHYDGDMSLKDKLTPTHK